MAKQKGDYKALTYLHLPVIEKGFAPGDTVTASELEEAEQDKDNIAQLVASGALGGMDDEIHPGNIIPSPTMPTISSVVQQAKDAVEQLEAEGKDVPDELRAVAELDFTSVTESDEGASREQHR